MSFCTRVPGGTLRTTDNTGLANIYDFLIEIADDPTRFSRAMPAGLVRKNGIRSRVFCPDGAHVHVSPHMTVAGLLRLNSAGHAQSPFETGQATLDAVARLYRSKRERMIDDIDGDFSFICVDDNRVFAARDHIGARPLYYCGGAARIAFATRPALLLNLDWVDAGVNHEWFGAYLLSMYEEGESTMYSSIHRLPAGHWLMIDGGAIQLRRYWRPETIDEMERRTDDAYVETFREALFRSVADRLDGSSMPASTLSGGLDSSTITGIARTTLGGRMLHTFSGLFAASGRSNEATYIAKVVEQGGITGHQIPMDGIAPLGSFDDPRDVFDEPFFAPNLFLHAGLFREAVVTGCDVLLDGLDGDTVVSHGLGRLIELARGLRLPALLHETRCVARGIGATTTGRLLWKSVVRPLFLRRPRLMYRAIRGYPHDPWGDEAYINSEFAASANLAERFVTLSEERARPVRTQREEHVRRITWPLHQYLLEVLFRLGNSIGIESRYPYYDRKLIETAIALPASMKLRDGWTRFVLRKCSQSVIPTDIAWRVGKADLGENFNKSFREMEVAGLERLIDNAQHSVWDYADRDKAQVALRMLRNGQNSTIMPLWKIVSLAPWIR